MTTHDLTPPPAQMTGRRDTRTLLTGLGFGIVFGFLLQRGGVTNYDVIVAQLLLDDFTVVKIMLSAVITGMIGLHVLKARGLVELAPKPGSFGSTVVGGLVFGVGFAILGLCPGTIPGAVGDGHLDAAVGGLTGILIGSWLFAVAYPQLERTILHKGDFGKVRLPELFKVDDWVVVVPVSVLIVGILALLQWSGR